MMRKDRIFIFFFIYILVTGCSNPQEQQMLSGKLTVTADASLLPVVLSEAILFHHFYKDAEVIARAVPEKEGVESFIRGNTEAIVASRALTVDEEKYLASRNIIPQQYTIGHESLIFIVSSGREDSVILLSDLRGIFEGKIRDWKETGTLTGKISLVVDGRNSSNCSWLTDSLGLSPSVTLFAAGSNEKVVEFVQAHPEALGIVNLNWWKHAGNKQETLGKVKIMPIRLQDGRSAWPFQEGIATGIYPFIKPVFFINKYQTGLGTGFVSYILSEDGQRVLLKAGLVPAIMPGREVILKKDF